MNPPQLRIHRAALLHNLSQFKRLAPHSQILLPVKANAYGCGIATLFPFFNEAAVDMLGVANVREAVELRSLGWKNPILNLGGFFAEEAITFTAQEITASLTDLWQVDLLDRVAQNKPAAIHIKLDLGMGRIGIRRDAIAALIDLLRAAKNISVTGIFTHFPHASTALSKRETADGRSTSAAEFVGSATRAQNAEFLQIAAEIISALSLKREDVILHAANSYNAAFFPETHHDMIRPGILFYGYYQSEADRLEFNPRFDFKPALELVATPISLRQLKKGDGISYSSLYHVQDEVENVGVLPLGYADGIPRALSNQISFGAYPLRGRVTMDQIILGHVSEMKPIRLLGEGVPSLEHWGELAQSFSYEIMSHLGNRLGRMLV